MTIPEALTAEIARVTTIRDQLDVWSKSVSHRGIGALLHVQKLGVKTKCATAALASGDPVAMQAALEDLKGYGNE